MRHAKFDKYSTDELSNVMPIWSTSCHDANDTADDFNAKQGRIEFIANKEAVTYFCIIHLIRLFTTRAIIGYLVCIYIYTYCSP